MMRMPAMINLPNKKASKCAEQDTDYCSVWKM